jgi:hypothetical protein
LDNQREAAAMAQNHVLPIETIVADAFALMRRRVKREQADRSSQRTEHCAAPEVVSAVTQRQ